MIVFDEAHKAKNLESDTRTAKLVLVSENFVAPFFYGAFSVFNFLLPLFFS
jgi:hypothetical protein